MREVGGKRGGKSDGWMQKDMSFFSNIRCLLPNVDMRMVTSTTILPKASRNGEQGNRIRVCLEHVRDGTLARIPRTFQPIRVA